MEYGARIAAMLVFTILMPYMLLNQPPEKPVAELPLDFEKNLPLVSILVKGSPQLFILDSASENCVIDDVTASQIGIKASAGALSSGSGGMVRVGLARGIRLQLAGLEINPDYVVLTGLSGLGFQKPVHGVIGFPLFGRNIVEIDYADKAVRVFAPHSFQPPRGAEVIPLWMTDGPTVRGRIKLAKEKAIEADFQLDTGSSHVLTVSKSFVDKHQMLAKVADLRVGRTFGIGGTSPDMVGRIESVGLGTHIIQNPEVRFSTHATGTLANPRFAANLGNGFLNVRVVIFDIPHSRLILTR